MRVATAFLLGILGGACDRAGDGAPAPAPAAQPVAPVADGGAAGRRPDPIVAGSGSPNADAKVVPDAHKTGPSTPVGPSGPRLALQVEASNYNACARFDDGSVSCWGNCGMGCETRSVETSAPMRRVLGLEQIVDVSVGDGFACTANRDGRVACWGSNNYGALGTVGIDWVASPRAVEGISGVLEVASTPTMTCARTQGGEVWVWGGSADASAPAVPTRLDGIVGATGIFGDSRRCCASLGAGGFACVDTGTHIAEPRPTRSGDCGCTLDERAHLTCELHEMPTSPGMRPDNYVAPLHPCSVAGLDDVREFVTTNAGYAIRSDGQLWRWGPTTQWGNQRTEPAVMTALPKVRSIAAGMGGAVFAVDDAGSIWGWGSSSQDAITHDDGWVATPVRIWNPAAP